MKLRPVLVFGLVGSLLGIAALRAEDPPPPPRTLDGEIRAAHWTALVPTQWNGFLILEAPDRAGTADLDPATPGHQSLLENGWALAATGYRRGTPAVADAIEDLRTLRDLLAARLGCPRLALVEGTGRGGLIATLMAERHADEFHAFLARDPAFDTHDPKLRCDHQPRGPLLFLATTGDTTGINKYLEGARSSANAESIVPVLWAQQAKDEAETGPAGPDPEAIEAMAAWVESREPPESRLAEELAEETSATTFDETAANEEPDEEAPPVEIVEPDGEEPPFVPVDD